MLVVDGTGPLALAMRTGRTVDVARVGPDVFTVLALASDGASSGVARPF